MADPRPRGSGDRAGALSQELSEFLIEFSIALHRHGMYPEGHPSLLPAEVGVVARLQPLIARRGSLSIGIARRQLIIEGVATDPKHPVLHELAGRLHRHHIGAVRFEPGLDVTELSDFLRVLALEADRTGEALGLGDAARLEAWPHIRAYPLTYGRLELLSDDDEAAGAEGGARAARLWIGLARAALAAPADQPVVNEEPAAVAEAINRHERAEAYDQVIVGYMLQIADELKSEGGASALALRRRVSSVIGGLTPDALERLVEMSGDLAQRQKFVADAAQVFAVDAVVDVMSAAAHASGQTISHSMLRMLSKLAAHADQGLPPVRARADSELRQQVRSLVDGWSAKDPNPTAYTLVLHEITRAAPEAAPPGASTSRAAECERIIQMALEIGVFGEMVAAAAEACRRASGLGALAQLLTVAEPDDRTAAAIWGSLARVAVLEEELARDELESEGLVPLVHRLGIEAVPPLLDALALAESRSTRRILLDLLRGIGGAVLPAVGAALAHEERWYVVRNLIALLADLGGVPAGFDAPRHLAHADARVRREVFRLLLQLPAERERMIAIALADPDLRILRQALTAARDGLPAAAVGRAVQRLGDDSLTPEMRVALIRALEGTRSPLALDALVRTTTSGRALLGGVRLAATTAESLAALRVLAHDWAAHPRAGDVLVRARKSRDPQVRQAAAGNT